MRDGSRAAQSSARSQKEGDSGAVGASQPHDAEGATDGCCRLVPIRRDANRMTQRAAQRGRQARWRARKVPLGRGAPSVAALAELKTEAEAAKAAKTSDGDQSDSSRWIENAVVEQQQCGCGAWR